MPLPLPEEEKRFKRSLETGRPYVTYALGDDYRTSVRALGRLSSAQFTMMARPGDYSNSWLDMDVPRPHIEGMMHTNAFQADHPEYKKLEESIMREGVRRPVIISQPRDVFALDDEDETTPIGRKRVVLDGHHRAFFAIKHQLHIPTVVLQGRR